MHSPGITSFATGTVSFGGSSTAVVPASADLCGLGLLLCLLWQSTGGLNGWGHSPAAVSTSPATRSCFPVSLPSPPVHSSRCSRPLAWPSRWPWLSSGCPFDRALGVRSLGPKNRNRAIVAQFRGAPFKKAAGSGLGECWSEVGEVQVRLRVSV